MTDYVYRITVWRKNPRPYQSRKKVRVATFRQVNAIICANPHNTVAVERAEVGTFNECSALFGCGPTSTGEGTWLVNTGPDPVRSRELNDQSTK